MKIIDVSYHQGVNIDFEKVKASGVEGVMIRAGYGKYISQKDCAFERNYKEAKRVGLNVGAYWYSYANSTASAAQEAAVCLQVIKGKTFELPIAFDIEYEPQILEQTKAQRTQLVKTFLDMIEQAGYYGMLYASTDFIKNKLNYKDLLRYDVWVAQYGSKCTCPMPYGIWQYSSKGIVDGVPTNVDLDIGYKDYPTIIKGAGLNGFIKTPGQPAGGDGEDAGETRPPESIPQPDEDNENPTTFTVGPVSSGDFAVLYNTVKAKADELGNIPLAVQ